jgi:hypothetical protein
MIASKEAIVYSLKELDSANNLNELESSFFLGGSMSQQCPADILILAL